MAATFADFKTEVPYYDLGLNSLPTYEQVMQCLKDSQAGRASTFCDTMIGSTATASGVCNMPEFRDTILCSCVNNSILCPTVTSRQCQSDQAYHPGWSAPGSAAFSSCTTATICQNYANIKGNDNVVDLTQMCGTGSGGSTGTDPASVPAAKPQPAVRPAVILLFVLLVLLAVILFAEREISNFEDSVRAQMLPTAATAPAAAVVPAAAPAQK